MWFFGGLGFSSVIFVNKPLKARCLSFKILYQHLLYLLSLWSYWHLKITQGPIRFWIGILEGVKWQAAYNGPKQQCSGIRGFLPSMCLSGCWEIFSEKTRGALPAWVSKEAKEVEYQELFNLFDNFHSMTYLFYFNFGFFPIFFLIMLYCLQNISQNKSQAMEFLFQRLNIFLKCQEVRRDWDLLN